LKDRLALCRQYLSIPAKFADRVAGVDDQSMRILHVRRHRNKLRTGHLKGNRFSVLVRGVRAEALDRAHAIQQHIAQHGFPNYFGEQRFGSAFQTVQTGIALLRGDTGAKDLPPGSRRFSLRFAISAVQSLLFNAALGARMNDGLTQTVLLGDVMQVTATGGLFVVRDVEREQDRCDRRETAIAGPMFGPKMKQPEEEVATRERDILDRYGLGADAFLKYRRLSSGTRRPYLGWPEALSIELHEDGLLFSFALRPGTYATVLLREFMQV
jgi:tRNA pseudouridine13 synthase